MHYTAITVIYNPNSTGSGESLARSFKTRLQKRAPKLKVTLQATEYAGHAEELAYEFAQKTDHPLVISSSGDGGYHEVINGIMKARKEGFDVTAGLLPAGNANDHYHNIHQEDIVDMIVEGKRNRIDLLKLKGRHDDAKVRRYGHSYIGFGLTPDVGNELNKNKLNIFNEVWIVARTLLNLRPVKLKIERKPHYYDSVIFSNVDKMSKYLKISQPSRINDGKFEVTIFKKRDKLSLILLLLRASFAGIKEDKQVRRFELETVKDTLVQIDGEIITLDANTTVRVYVEKQILPCVV